MRELSIACARAKDYFTSVVKTSFQISALRCLARAAIFACLASPVAAHALVVSGGFFLGGGSNDLSGEGLSTQDYKDDYGFGAGSIVQIVAIKDSDMSSLATTTHDTQISGFLTAIGHGEDASRYSSSTANDAAYFTSDIPDPYHETVGDQRVVQTTTLDSDLYVDIFLNYDSLLSEGYTGFYIRVFSATSFPQGQPVSNVVWGASAIYKFQGDVHGGENAYMAGITVVSTNATFEVIPEPATTGLFLFGAAALLAHRRRRHCQSIRGGRAMNANRFLFPVLLCTALSAASGARASVVEPVYLMPGSPVVDALGEPFPGTCNTGDGGLVEIRKVGFDENGIPLIVPPDPENGKGDDGANPILLTGHLGDNTIGRDTGLFTLAIQDPDKMPSLGVAYFARVFDAPDAADAVLYSDSEPFTLASYSSIDTCTYLVFPGSRSVDPDEDAYVDSDGDGWTDREEASLRSHDSDGDGWSDWFEITHGMDVSTPFSLGEIALEDIEEPDLAAAGVHSIESLSDDELASIPWTITGKGISWISISGMTYVIDFSTNLLAPDSGFKGVFTNRAESTNAFVDVSEYFTDALTPLGFFRVKAVPQPSEGPVRTGNE